MICFSLEVKYGNMFNTHAFMQRHRVDARGNATTFPLPWEVLLQELQKLDSLGDAQQSVELPRTGAELRYVVQLDMPREGVPDVRCPKVNLHTSNGTDFAEGKAQISTDSEKTTD